MGTTLSPDFCPATISKPQVRATLTNKKLLLGRDKRTGGQLMK
jgi:hypothetical protein